MRTDLVEQAQAIRAGMQALARTAPDAVLLAQPMAMYDEWDANNGLLYRCVQAHTSQATWTPEAAASLWTRIADPTQEWPEWIQPTGAHNAYAKGAKVSHNGKHWISDVDANVWEPGVYGWTEQAEE